MPSARFRSVFQQNQRPTQAFDPRPDMTLRAEKVSLRAQMAGVFHDSQRNGSRGSGQPGIHVFAQAGAIFRVFGRYRDGIVRMSCRQVLHRTQNRRRSQTAEQTEDRKNGR